MKKRFIAAFVLASLAAWSVPVAFASPLQSGSSTAQNPAELSSSMHDHSCCPGIHSRLAPLFVTPAPAEMPCGEQHPCCAKQTPQSQPALPAASTTLRPGSDGAPVAIAEQPRNGQTRIAAEATGTGSFQPYSVRSTVLRV